MSTRNTVAGLLTAFGVIGLAMAPLQARSDGPPSSAQVDQVAVAISLGSHLRLDLEGANSETKPRLPATARNMVCGNVYRLPVANIGLNCRATPAAKTVALAD